MAGDYRPPVFHSQIEILSAKKTVNSLSEKNANFPPEKKPQISLPKKKTQIPSRKKP